MSEYIYVCVCVSMYVEKLSLSKTIHAHSLITMLNQIKHLIIYLSVKTSSQHKKISNLNVYIKK